MEENPTLATLKGSENIKTFLISAMETMLEEDSDNLQVDMVLPNGTKVVFELTILDIIENP